jgi:hypothetical protein
MPELVGFVGLINFWQLDKTNDACPQCRVALWKLTGDELSLPK